MHLCELCNEKIPFIVIIDGKKRNLKNRKYCLKCSPFGSKNRTNLKKWGKKFDEITHKEKRKRINKRTYVYQKKQREERKRKLVDYFGGRCIKCGYFKCIAALEFHHINPEEKNIALSASGLMKKWDVVLEEAKKCDLLCSNCHAEEHYNKNRET
jgi:hypothetical protein